MIKSGTFWRGTKHKYCGLILTLYQSSAISNNFPFVWRGPSMQTIPTLINMATTKNNFKKIKNKNNLAKIRLKPLMMKTLWTQYWKLPRSGLRTKYIFTSQQYKLDLGSCESKKKQEAYKK